MTTKHTAGPWEAGPLDSDGVPIYSGPTDDAELIARVYDVDSAETEANAEFIVRACNSYNVLLAACKDAYNAFEEMRAESPAVRTEATYQMGYLRAAVAKAEKGA